jgi:hypothetical protein
MRALINTVSEWKPIKKNQVHTGLRVGVAGDMAFGVTFGVRHEY